MEPGVSTPETARRPPLRSGVRGRGIRVGQLRAAIAVLVAAVTVASGAGAYLLLHTARAPAPPQLCVCGAEAGNSGAVERISDVSATVVATWHTDSAALAVAGDGALEETFVALADGQVDVIADGNDSLVATVAVGAYSGPFAPEYAALAYAPGLDQLFVAYGGPSTPGVTVINATSDRIQENLTLPHVRSDVPWSFAYDAATDRLFVAELGEPRVAEVNVSSDAIAAEVGVGNYTTGLAYDPLLGEVVAVDANGNLSAISDRSNTVVLYRTVSASPEAVVYDSGVRAFFVLAASGSIVAVNPSTLRVTGHFSACRNPSSLGYDNVTGEIAVGCGLGEGIALVDDSGYATLANVTAVGLVDSVTFEPWSHSFVAAEVVPPAPAQD